MESLQKQPKSMEELPEEVLAEIIIRLPAKRIGQLRCVCKPLNALSSNPSFIKSHLHRSIPNNDEMLLVFHNRFCFEGGKPITAHPSRSPHIVNPNFIKLPVNFNIPSAYNCSSVIGSVNGLICFVVWSSIVPGPDPIIYIWNPSLSAVTTLPPFTIRGFDDLYFRFGFDPKTDDFKVVKLTRLLHKYIHYQSGVKKNCFEWLQVEVYSMRNGYWKIINDRFPSHVVRFSDEDVSITGNDGHDGRLHWLCNVVSRRAKQTIIAFDLATEIFSEIYLPDSIANNKKEPRKQVLGDLAGKLCVISYIEDGDIKDGDVEVWVMNEYGVAESWVKHHMLSQFSGNVVPIGITLSNEFILQGEDDSLALYDHIAAKVKSFKVIDINRYSYGTVQIVPYVDSLVWIAPANRVDQQQLRHMFVANFGKLITDW
ncbi:putative F-box domain-containing protein [Helianthus debilis subsp. tardiflorus]